MCTPSLTLVKTMTMTKFHSLGCVSNTNRPVFSQDEKVSVFFPHQLCQKLPLKTIAFFYFGAVIKQSQEGHDIFGYHHYNRHNMHSLVN